jgi:oligoribonuclease
MFLRAHMPLVDQYLHYRIVDVSAVKELAARWYPALPRFEKREQHRALDDIRESIAELRYYREQLFRPALPG